MFYRRNCLPVRAFVLLDDAMTYKLLGGMRVLAVREPRKMLLCHGPGKIKLISQLAMPLAQSPVVLLPIILFGRRELLGVVRLRLRCGERFGDRQHSQSPNENPVSTGSSSLSP